MRWHIRLRLGFRAYSTGAAGGAWTEATLYIFQGAGAGDGGAPTSGLISDAAGNLYGVTGYGGTGSCTLVGTLVGCGTVYEMVRPAQPGGAWTERILYSFQGGNDGYVPSGDLAMDIRGNLYGATLFGGGKGANCNDLYGYCGTIFELSPPRATAKSNVWTEKILYNFEGVDTGDGGNPNGGLLFGKNGVIYGTTSIGGYDCPHNSGQGCGTLFSLSPPENDNSLWVESILHDFGYREDGGGPNGDLVFDSNGNLYGSTLGGGAGRIHSGIVFRFSPQPDGTFAETILHSFDSGADGGLPRAGVTFDKKGDLCGTATAGGTGGGTLFCILAKTRFFLAAYAWGPDPDGNYPNSVLKFDSTGNIYGTTLYGGTGQACNNYGCGTVFVISPTQAGSNDELIK